MPKNQPTPSNSSLPVLETEASGTETPLTIQIKNIGIIADAKIKLNGLTVITGPNNSGKTTVGRCLYSLVSAVENLQKNAVYDRLKYARTKIETMFLEFILRSGWYSFFEVDIFDNTEMTPTLEKIAADIEKIISKLDNVTETEFLEYMKKQMDRFQSDNLIRYVSRDFQIFINKKTEILSKLQSLKNTILEDPEFIEYANTRIGKKFDKMFFGQITPLAGRGTGNSECVFSEKNNVFFEVVFNDNSREKERYRSASPFASALFVDNGAVLDDMSDFWRSIRENQNKPFRGILDELPSLIEAASAKDFLESFSVESHKEDLLRSLLLRQTTITGEIETKKEIDAVMKKIDKAVSFGVRWEKGRFVSSDLKIDLRNLAQGSKTFLIIKMLLENGTLNKNSILILDEPETHLHPEWQALFAEVVVLLVKHMGCSVLLTTHSPEFIIALDVNSREHEIVPKTNFYISNPPKVKNKLVSFDEIGLGEKKMNDVYLHLAKPFMELESRRLELYDEGEEDEEE
jgi:AAA15 family ATPase/GTPase